LFSDLPRGGNAKGEQSQQGPVRITGSDKQLTNNRIIVEAVKGNDNDK